MTEPHSSASSCQECALNSGHKRYHTLGHTIMLLTFLFAHLRAKPAFVWKPAVTLTDPRIVSELTGAAN